VDVHLPCPPLREYLPARLAGLRVAAWLPSAPRRVRSLLRRWPQLDPDEQPAPHAELPYDALLFGVSLERPNPPDLWLAGLPAGALILEFAVPRRRLVRELLGLHDRAAARAAAGQARALQWLARGCFELEQWEAVDPPGVLVTLARVRR
jgi:hypothetical protein